MSYIAGAMLQDIMPYISTIYIDENLIALPSKEKKPAEPEDEKAEHK